MWPPGLLVSMQNRITFYGLLKLENGLAVLEIPDKRWLPQLAIEALGAGPVRIDITHDDKGKESGLLKYYWGSLIPMISEAFQALGNRWNAQETHEQLKRLFPQHFPSRKPASIKAMSRHRFRAYVTDVELFAAEFLCISTERLHLHTDAAFPDAEHE